MKSVPTLLLLGAFFAVLVITTVKQIEDRARALRVAGQRAILPASLEGPGRALDVDAGVRIPADRAVEIAEVLESSYP